MLKFVCDTKDFTTAVRAAAGAVKNQTTVPILQHLFLESDDSGRVTVSGTDLEITVKRTFVAKIIEAGTCTVPGKLLSSYLDRVSTPSDVEFSGDDEKVTIQSGRSNTVLNTLPAAEYPAAPAPSKTASFFSIDATRFQSMVNGVAFCASTEESRGAVLMATLLEAKDGDLTVVATDGYRLARMHEAFDDQRENKELTQYLVPTRALTEVSRNAKLASSIEISLLKNNEQMTFKNEHSVVIVRLVSGQYPNYAQIIPHHFDRQVVVNTADLLGAIKRAELIAGDRASTVTLQIEPGQIIITAAADTTGNAHEEIDGELTGEPLKIMFNGGYLMKILQNLNSERVLLESSGPLSPAMISPGVEANGQSYILMPLRQ